MRKSSFYVGVDVGQSELWAAIAGTKPRAFVNSTTGIKSLQRWVSGALPSATIHYAMEATGVYSQTLATRLLHDQESIEVSITNPAQIVAFGRAQLRRCKSDRLDCQVILEYAQSQKPPRWQPESKTLQQLRSLVSQADAVQRNLLEWNNRSHTHQQSLELPSLVKKSTAALQRVAERQLELLQAEIKSLCTLDPELQVHYKLLQTIPGVGEKSAAAVMAYGGSALTERSRKQLTAHAGLAPRSRQSGTSLHQQGHLAKEGNKQLRKALYMPALVATQHNPIIRQTYQRLLARGKPKMVALVACMRKLLLIIRSILIHQKPFNPTIRSLT